MVDMDLVVYHVRNKNTGDETFLSDDEIESSDDPEDWDEIETGSRVAREALPDGEQAAAPWN